MVLLFVNELSEIVLLFKIDCPFLILTQDYKKLYLTHQQQKMQHISCFIKPDQERYVIIIPSFCQTTPRFPLSQLIKCKFCKSFTTPHNQQVSVQCEICRCYNDVPQNIIPFEPSELSQSFVAVDENVDNEILRILLVYHVQGDDDLANGLLCLAQILPKMGPNIQIGCLLYDENVRVVDLSPDGEMIRVNISSLGILEQKFEAVSSEVLDRLITVLTESKTNKSLVNGSKIISQIVPFLIKKTVILWVGNFNEDSTYIEHPKSSIIDVYAFLRIPPNVGTMSFSKALGEIAKNCTKVKLILKNNSERVAQELHYQLYDIFQNLTLRSYTVQASRQRKYPPEILTPYKESLLGSLRNSVILKLGKQVQKNENIQIRINYLAIQQGKQHRETLCINFNFQKNSEEGLQQHDRLLSLYKIMKANPTRKQTLDSPATNQFQLQIFQFLRQCSFLQRFQLNQCLANPNCIFMVWPWVGFKNGKPKFVFYFKGYHCEIAHQTDLQRMLQLCQISYARKDRILPTYFYNKLELIEENYDIIESDEQFDFQDNQHYYSFTMDQLEQNKKGKMDLYE